MIEPDKQELTVKVSQEFSPLFKILHYRLGHASNNALQSLSRKLKSYNIPEFPNLKLAKTQSILVSLAKEHLRTFLTKL